MKIVKVRGTSVDRYFVAESPRDYETIALRLLNEQRVLLSEDDNPKLKEFVEQITDAQDGDLARSLADRLYDITVINPEIV